MCLSSERVRRNSRSFDFLSFCKFAYNFSNVWTKRSKKIPGGGNRNISVICGTIWLQEHLVFIVIIKSINFYWKRDLFSLILFSKSSNGCFNPILLYLTASNQRLQFNEFRLSDWPNPQSGSLIMRDPLWGKLWQFSPESLWNQIFQMRGDN